MYTNIGAKKFIYIYIKRLTIHSYSVVADLADGRQVQKNDIFQVELNLYKL